MKKNNLLLGLYLLYFLSGPLFSLTDFEKEFEPNSLFATKVENLLRHKGLSKMRKARRDGNCFYRSYIYGIFEGLAKDAGFRKR